MRSVLLELQQSGRAEQALAKFDTRDLHRLRHDWRIWARDDQLPPFQGCGDPAWQTWLILGGRGAGKTRAGAEWVRSIASEAGAHVHGPELRIALIGETLDAARAVMIDGVSGLRAIHPDHERPRFEPSKRRLVWPNGAIAELFSAEDPESLRGPQFSAAWCDELCKWRHAEATWDMLQFGLRLGDRPQQVVTTTPRPIPLLKRLLGDPRTVVSRARTIDNAANLSGAFLTAVRERYAGTWLGRQELDGEIVEDRADALWRRAWIDGGRVSRRPVLERIIVAVDPPVTTGKRADACGIVVAGLGEDGRAYVLADETVEGCQPQIWAARVAKAYSDYRADRVVAEVNQGGELVAIILRQVDDNLPVRMVRATRGKWVRAEPVAALYARGRVAHVGTFAELEDQLCNFGTDGLQGGRSPDRLDALVWALTDLMLSTSGQPRARPV